MKTSIFVSLLAVLIAGLVLVVYLSDWSPLGIIKPDSEGEKLATETTGATPIVEAQDSFSETSDETIEITARTFVQNVIEAAPPNSDTPSALAAKDLLTLDNQSLMSEEPAELATELVAFVGMEEAPDQGFSSEDLQTPDEYHATVVLGLNYSDQGQVIKHINLVIENGEWRVTSVTEPET